MARAPKAKVKGVQPGGANIRVPRHRAKPRKPTPRHPTVNPGGLMLNVSGHVPRNPPAPPSSKKKTVAKKKTAKRGASLGEAVPCCAAEALAASLRLAGWVVSDAEVLALHRLATCDPMDCAYIEDVLEAAALYGLAGVHLAGFRELDLDGQLADKDGSRCDSGVAVGSREPVPPVAVILGIDQPRPHTVLDDGSAWWSWGQPWEPFAGAVISEAWSLRWVMEGQA